jgi:hypothetical protein
MQLVLYVGCRLEVAVTLVYQTLPDSIQR